MGRATHYRSRYAFDLSPRQREVLERIARGRTNAEIAAEFGISLDGVKWHVREVLGKIGVESREEAADLWRASRRPGARLRRLVPAVITGFSWRVLAAAGVAVVAVAGALAGYAALGGDSPPTSVAAGAVTQDVPGGSSPSAAVVAASATPGLPAANCDPAKLSLEPAASSNGQPASGIFVAFQNAGGECEASGTLSLSIVSAGGGLIPGIVGNPMQFSVNFEVQGASGGRAGTSGVGIAEWSNWCGADADARLQAAFEPGDLSSMVPISGLPSCTDRGSPSVMRQPIGTGPPPGQGAFVLEHQISRYVTNLPSASPTPVPAGQPLPYCDSSLLKLAATAAGKVIDATVTGFTGDCRVDWPSASFRLMSLVGTVLPVDGNGAPVAVSGTSSGPPLGVELRWSNWCGTHTDVILELDTGGARIDTYVAPPPCDDEDAPSTVTYARLPAGLAATTPAALTLLPGCDPNLLTPELSSNEAAKDATVRVQVSNDGPACAFSGDVTVTVNDAGVAIRAPGNPGVVRITARLPAGGEAPVAVGVWPDVCLNGESMSLTAQLATANGTTPGTTEALPAACAVPGVPSSLRLSPANAYASAGVTVCDPSSLELKAAAQGVAQLELVTTAIDAAQPCWLSGTVRFTATTPGDGSVSGNPADLQVSALLLPGANTIGAAYWSNWCGPNAAGAVTVTLVSTDLASTAKGPPPACDSPGDPSRLQLASWANSNV